MFVEQFLDPKEVEVGGKTYRISRIPALEAQAVYADIIRTTGDYGDLGMTMMPESLVLRILKYCAVKVETGDFIVLDTRDIVNTNLTRTIDLIALQLEMVKHNFSFLTDGSLTSLLGLPVGSRQSR